MSDDYNYLVQDHIDQEQEISNSVKKVLDNLVAKETQANDHLAQARKNAQNYEGSATIAQDRFYRRTMMHAAIAQAEAMQEQADSLRRIANALERIHIWTGA